MDSVHETSQDSFTYLVSEDDPTRAPRVRVLCGMTAEVVTGEVARVNYKNGLASFFAENDTKMRVVSVIENLWNEDAIPSPHLNYLQSPPMPLGSIRPQPAPSKPAQSEATTQLLEVERVASSQTEETLMERVVIFGTAALAFVLWMLNKWRKT